ncbi:hypothetical protein F443_23221 [Phytophthora nicotianae P1569]|uniref:Uncharacterized protein n=1 Tax=Phytophthora nicotianae P1569 TaxID=1317065 RepID=V9DRX4_PHYNI|nr:hypothetical protein F443_23221 [Phytophthora nicotianae P1569]
MAKVHERLKSVPDRLSEQVMADIYDLHFATTSAVFDEQAKQVVTKWSGDKHLVGFKDYFERTWCFHTPSGFATTNNPVEQFDRLIKCDYTLRTKHKIGTLVHLLADCCQHQSVTPKVFKELPEPTQQLKTRVKDFRRRDLLLDRTPGRSSIEFLLVSANPDEIRVLSRGCSRVYLPELGRSRETALSRLRWAPITLAWRLKVSRMMVGASMLLR